MRVRALSTSGDWTFGSGYSNYAVNINAIQQNIQTRLSSFINDCFFDATAGLDWFNFMGGSKNQLAISLAISAVILNTPDDQGNPVITGINQLSADYTGSSRNLTINYSVITVYSTTGVSTGTISGSATISLTG